MKDIKYGKDTTLMSHDHIDNTGQKMNCNNTKIHIKIKIVLDFLMCVT